MTEDLNMFIYRIRSLRFFHDDRRSPMAYIHMHFVRHLLNIMFIFILIE